VAKTVEIEPRRSSDGPSGSGQTVPAADNDEDHTGGARPWVTLAIDRRRLAPGGAPHSRAHEPGRLAQQRRAGPRRGAEPCSEEQACREVTHAASAGCTVTV